MGDKVWAPVLGRGWGEHPPHIPAESHGGPSGGVAFPAERMEVQPATVLAAVMPGGRPPCQLGDGQLRAFSRSQLRAGHARATPGPHCPWGLWLPAGPSRCESAILCAWEPQGPTVPPPTRGSVVGAKLCPTLPTFRHRARCAHHGRRQMGLGLQVCRALRRCPYRGCLLASLPLRWPRTGLPRARGGAGSCGPQPSPMAQLLTAPAV